MIMYSAAALINTFYQFKEDYLYIKSGFFKTMVPYKMIMVLKKSNKFFTYNCLSIHKFKITYRNGTQMLEVHLSPKNEDEFIKQIRYYCKSVKIEKDK